MRAYELMIILHPDVDDAAVGARIEQVTGNLSAAGGVVASEARWGKRRFAYEINHLTEGYYVVMEVVTEPRDMSDLDRMLRLADDVIRHKLVRLPDDEAARRGLIGNGAGVPDSANPDSANQAQTEPDPTTTEE